MLISTEEDIEALIDLSACKEALRAACRDLGLGRR